MSSSGNVRAPKLSFKKSRRSIFYLQKNDTKEDQICKKKEKTKNDNMNIEYSNLKLVKFAENH